MTAGRLFIFIFSLFAAAAVLGGVAAEYSPFILLGATATIVLFVVAFLNTEIGLYILVFSMLLSPELGVGATTGGAALGRGVTLRLDDLLLLIIGLSWLAKNAIHKELGLFLRTSLNRPIFFYMVACLLSTGLGIMVDRVSPKTGFFFVLKYFEYFIVFFMIANHLENEKQMKRFVFCMFLTCFIASIIGMAQIPLGGRVSAPFEGKYGEPNTFGGYLVFMGSVAAGVLSTAKDRKTRILLILLLVAIIPPFLFTRSRSSYLAALPAFLMLGLMAERKVIVTCLLLIGLILSPLVMPQEVKERVLYTFTQQSQAGQVQIGEVRLDTSTSARLASWKKGLADWTKQPLLGYGVTGYAFLDAQFPRILVETGILGLLVFLFLLYTIYKLAAENLKNLKQPLHQGLIRGFIAGYVGLLFHAIGANTFIIVRIMEPFWFILGIIAVLPVLDRSDGPEQILPDEEFTRGRDKTWRLPRRYGSLGTGL